MMNIPTNQTDGRKAHKEDSAAIWLVTPGNRKVPITIIPSTRGEITKLLTREWFGEGVYEFIQEIPDSTCSVIELTSLAFLGCSKNDFGMTLCTDWHDFPMTAEDVSKYLLRKVTGLHDKMVKLHLDVYENRQETDIGWLCLEEQDGTEIAEFGLALTNRIFLPEHPDASGGCRYIVELPTLRSVLRFMNVVANTLGCETLISRSFPINSTSLNWFA